MPTTDRTFAQKVHALGETQRALPRPRQRALLDALQADDALGARALFDALDLDALGLEADPCADGHDDDPSDGGDGAR